MRDGTTARYQGDTTADCEISCVLPPMVGRVNNVPRDTWQLAQILAQDVDLDRIQTETLQGEGDQAEGGAYPLDDSDVV